MTYIVPPIDHQEEAVDLTLSQFDNSPNLLNLIRSWLVPLNELEADLQEWAQYNRIEVAYGDFLDKIGSWMGVERGIMLDEAYRQAILAQSLIEGVDGTTEKLLEGMRVMCQTDQVTFHELYPATVYAHCGDGYNNATYTQIKRIVAAGKHLRLLVDQNLDSMVMSEVLEEDNGLVTGDQEQYIVVVDGVEYDWVTSVTSSVLTDDSGDYLAETFDTEWTPLADMVLGPATLVDGVIIDDQGNPIVDEQGNNFTYREFI